MKRYWLATAGAAILVDPCWHDWADRSKRRRRRTSFRVGVVLPLSGQFALGGQNVKRGYDLAAEDINAAGGIKALGGAQIELVYADNQGKQDVAIGETERLIQQERVSAIMGSWHSPTHHRRHASLRAQPDALDRRGGVGRHHGGARVQICLARQREGELVRRSAGRLSRLCQEHPEAEGRARRHHVYR